MTDPSEIHLLPELDEEASSLHRRETFMVSVFVHLAAILFLITHPDFLSSLTPPPAIRPEEQRQATILYEPPEPPQAPRPRLQAPPAAPRAPAEPRLKAQPLPEQQPNVVVPNLPQPQPPKQDAQRQIQPPEPAGGKGQDLVARSMEPIGIPDFSKQAAEPPKQKPALEP